MSISIGDAVLKLGVDTKDLDKGMQGISATIQKHQKAIGVAMVAAGGAILAAGALSIKTFAAMGDEVQKMALRTGFSTEALSELRHAAEIAGGSLQSLEKGVKRMSSTILDASDGMETYVRAFEHIGIKVEELMALSPEEQFMKIAMAIAELEDPTMRAAIAQDMFGRAGTELLPLFAEGADGIAKLREEAHKLGIVFDQEAADKAAEFTDAMARLNEAISGVKMVIGGTLAETLQPFVDEIRGIISSLSEWTKEHPRLTTAIILGTTALGGLLVVLGSLLLLMPGLTAALAAFGITLHLALGPIALVALGIAGLVAAGISLWKYWDSITADLSRVWTNLSSAGIRAFNAVSNAVKSAIDYVLSLYEAIKKLWDMLLAMLGITGKAPTAPGYPVPASPYEARDWYRQQERYLAHLATITPGLQQGGTIAQTGLALVHKGETVIPQGQPAIEVTIHNYLDGNELESYISQKIIKEVRLQGGI